MQSGFSKMMMLNRARTSMMLQPFRSYHMIASPSQDIVDKETPVLVYQGKEHEGKYFRKFLI